MERNTDGKREETKRKREREREGKGDMRYGIKLRNSPLIEGKSHNLLSAK